MELSPSGMKLYFGMYFLLSSLWRCNLFIVLTQERTTWSQFWTAVKNWTNVFQLCPRSLCLVVALLEMIGNCIPSIAMPSVYCLVPSVSEIGWGILAKKFCSFGSTLKSCGWMSCFLCLSKRNSTWCAQTEGVRMQCICTRLGCSLSFNLIQLIHMCVPLATPFATSTFSLTMTGWLKPRDSTGSKWPLKPPGSQPPSPQFSKNQVFQALFFWQMSCLLSKHSNHWQKWSYYCLVHWTCHFWSVSKSNSSQEHP